MKRLILAVSFLTTPVIGFAQSSAPCPRFQPGSAITPAKGLFSSCGRLEVTFNYNSRVDDSGNTLYCFTSAQGAQSPTLHVQPGDELIIHLNNQLPPGASMQMAPMPEMWMSPSAGACGTSEMTTNSVNIHYHGTNTPPTCHQDEVIKTAVDGGQSFEYRIRFPKDEPLLVSPAHS